MPLLHQPNPFDHVLDGPSWTFFESLFGGPVEWHFRKIGNFQITKYMVMELIAAGLIVAIFVPLSRWAAREGLPKGRFWNAFESLLTFVRNGIARPAMGEHEADKYVPFLWTTFLFILFCNLLGMFPFLASPTANIYMTGGLALCAFVMLHGCAIVKMGGWNYLKSLWPHIDVPYVGWLFSGFIFGIELLGTFIKSGVLAVRLFANMFAGHLVLAIILFFIFEVGQLGNLYLWGAVTFASVLGVTALSLLELFVAFLQAYVFTFLTALFIGMSLHPQH
jgi:F-type H+-transporting ATPase subunit a